MFNHAPNNYQCPLCLAVQGIENEHTLVRQNDIFYKDELIMAFINSRRWPNNPGGVLLVSNQHFENLYDIPEGILARIYVFTKKVAIALKETYQCDGISIRQHNEPAGNQDAWHFHVHVMPRYTNDQLYQLDDQKTWTTSEERKPYADKLREYFPTHSEKL